MDPNGDHHDQNLNLEDDDFAIVPQEVQVNEEDIEVPQQEQQDGYEEDNEDDEDNDEEEEPEEEDNFWVAQPAAEEDDALPEMDWHEVFNFNPAPGSVIPADLPDDWNEGAVLSEDDQPIVYDMLTQGNGPLHPLTRMERELAKLTEERDRLLRQQDKDWDEIAELQVMMAQLQAKIQEVQLGLNQVRGSLQDEKARTQRAEEQAARMEAAIGDLCAKVREEMCLANREGELTDKEFQKYVRVLEDRRRARRSNGPQPRCRQMQSGEGSSRTHED